MLAWIRQRLGAPVFEDEEKTRVARLLNTALLAFLAAMVLVVVSIPVLYGFPATPEDVFTLLSGIVVAVTAGALLILTRRGHLQAASVVLLSLIWIIITYWILTVAGISSDFSPLAYPLIIVLAGLLLGGRAAILFTASSVLVVLGAYYVESNDLLIVADRPLTIMDPILTATSLTLTGLLLYHAMNSMIQALERARGNERAQIDANRQLEALRATLEQRVAHRTRDLERRTVQLQAAAQVSRAVTSILDTEQLIWQVAELIEERFNLYHVGIFQLDATGEWAEYRGGAGESGRLLAEEDFRLEVGGESMVGWCTAYAQTRVAQDVSMETARVDHPVVPSTRSEAALPLITRGQVIGAISVQSDQAGAFDPDLVATLQTIAEQVAVALDNARLFTESQESLKAARRAYGQLSREAWTELLRGRTRWGYSYAHQAVGLAEGDWPSEMLRAMRTGQIVQGNSTGKPMLAIPLKVREETVGVLGFYKGSEGKSESFSRPTGWTKAEIGLLERLVHQLGLSLESAQLYEETQRRAMREKTTREITARMRETLDVQTVLRTAADEVRLALGLPEVVIQLRSKSAGQSLHRRETAAPGHTFSPMAAQIAVRPQDSLRHDKG